MRGPPHTRLPFPNLLGFGSAPESARAAGWCRATHHPVLIGKRTPTESNALDDLGYIVKNDDVSIAKMIMMMLMMM